MTISLLVLILVVPLNILLGLLVLRKNPKKELNITFAGLTFSIVIWTTGLFLFQTSKNYSFSLMGLRLSFTAIILLAFFFLTFCYLFPSKNYIARRLVLPLVLITVAAGSISMFTNQVVDKIEFFVWGANGVYGPLYYLFVAYFATYMVSGLVVLIVKYTKTTGLAKEQLRYLFAGFILSLAMGSITNLVIPAIFSSSRFSKFGPLATIFLVSASFYTIIRYRFLDIRLVIKRSTIYTASLFFTLVIIALIYLLIWRLLPAFLIEKSITLNFISLVLGIAIFLPLRNLFRKLADKLMFADVFSYQNALKDLSSRLTSIIKLKEIVDSILYVMVRVMRLERAGILLKDQKNIFRVQKVLGFDETNGISLVKNNFLTSQLIKYPKALIKEELQIKIAGELNQQKKQKLREIVNYMDKIQASLILPLITHQQLIGLVVLGSKEGSMTYTHEDLDLLTTLTNQAAVALDNARLYTQMESIVQARTRKLQEQTDRLTHQTSTLKQANKKLIRLSKIKSEFLTIASHQLRTPLSAAWGFLSMLKDGTLDKEPEQEKKRIYVMIYESVSRLNNIVNDLLDAMEADNQNLKINKTELNLNQLIQDSISQASPQANERNVSFNFKPNPNLPFIQADQKYFPEVIRNLIDNAIKYTPTDKHGTITITAKQPKNNHNIILTIQDQGVGIPSSDLPKLFTQFQRAANARRVHTDGSGLGLYIARKVLEAHQGSISITSPGIGQGSTVTVEIPTKVTKRWRAGGESVSA